MSFVRARRCLSGLFFILILGFFTVPGQTAQRIISTLPSNTEILYELGLGDKIVAVSDYCNYPEAARAKPKIGGLALNYEKIVALEPTLIVMGQEAQPRDVARLKALGLPVAAVKGSSLTDVASAMAEIGVYTGQTERGLLRSVKFVKDIQSVEQRAREVLGGGHPKAFVEIWHAPLMTATPRSLVGNIVEKAGLSNIARNSRGDYPLYSMEKLFQEDPEFIIVPADSVGRIAQLSLDPLWQTLAAVKNHRVLYLDEDALVRPGPRASHGLELLVDAVARAKKEPIRE